MNAQTLPEREALAEYNRVKHEPACAPLFEQFAAESNANERGPMWIAVWLAAVVALFYLAAVIV